MACALLFALLFATGLGGARAESVKLPAGDAELVAHWLPAPGATQPRPAIVALHGCSGLYLRDGKTFYPRYLEYVERLHRAGYHVLLPDSFGSRGSGAICTQKASERKISVEMRRGDVLAAIAWLTQQPKVDARRIALLGWSHGAMTTLAAINAEHAHYARPLAGAVVFYPGCTSLLRDRFRLDVPLLMLLGAKDDWTPPFSCVDLARRTLAAQPAADLTWTVYPDSYHGFDSSSPVRFRADIPAGRNPNGVHQGGNPAARAQSQQAMEAFLARILK